ncbi:MAG TPA: MgtC/SapB family protein [Acidimicrobiales bacterium]|nr:MgtC/SapB family protein [Acidimicrobiales bacterium]
MTGVELLGATGDTSYAVDPQVLVRLLSAAVLGGMVGLEREVRDQEAGVRTHLAVALGASLFGVISTLGFVEFDRPRAESLLQVDVSRVASSVPVGIGFLGAGVIFRRRNAIKNLTTAASLWAVTAIGLACGVGDPVTAAIATTVLLVGLVALRPLRYHLARRFARRAQAILVHLTPGTGPDAVIAALDRIDHGEVTLRKSTGHLVLSCQVAGPPDVVLRWTRDLAALAGVDTIEDEQ